MRSWTADGAGVKTENWSVFTEVIIKIKVAYTVYNSGSGDDGSSGSDSGDDGSRGSGSGRGGGGSGSGRRGGSTLCFEKKHQLWFLPITSANIDRFSKSFHL